MKNGIFGSLGLVIVGVVAVLAYLGMFIVDPTQQVLVLRFGQPVRALTTPGLYFKIPLIDNVEYVEKRVLGLELPPLEIIASDQKRLVVDAFGRYKVSDPLKFYQTVGSETVAAARLAVILNSSVRRVLGESTFIAAVRDDRDGLMRRITDQVNTEADRLGIDVIDVRLRRADLPESNSQAIYQRMQTERQREATEIRANGEQANRRIRAEADREVTILIAEANKLSEQIRGEGDASKNRIFAAAFNRDPEFFAFYRSMQAYQDSLGGSRTRLVLAPDSEFFRYFGDPLGARSGGMSLTAPSGSAGGSPAPREGSGLPAPALPVAPATPAR